MTERRRYAKTLALPAGFDAPRLRRYDDVTAHAITRDDLGADVRGINAGLDLIRETRGGPGWDSASQITFAGVGLGLRDRRNGFDHGKRRRCLVQLAV